jgi:zinc protease
MAPETAPGAAPVHEHRLSNGLLVLLKPNHSAPVINLNVVYRVGSKYERPGITGVSHLLEHMMFKSTLHVPNGEFDKRLKRVGADNNAYTWLDQTVYYETIAADQIDVALELEAERMQHLLVSPEDHATEMTVVRNELDQRDDSPFTLLYEELLSLAFKAHPYAIPTIGWADDVEGMTPDEIRAYYRTWYHPDNAFIVAAGDFEPDVLLAKIESHFGNIPAGGVKHPRLPAEPPQRGEKRFTLQRAGQVDFLLMGWHLPASTHPDAYATLVLGDVLGGGRTSRLYKALVDSGICTSASAESNAFDYIDPHLFTVSAVLNPGRTPAEAEAAIWAEIARLAGDPADASELARARKQARASFVFERDSLVREAGSLVDFELLPGGWRSMYDYLPGIEAVTPADVQRAAGTYLTHENATVGVYLASKDEGGPADADDFDDEDDEGDELPELAVRRPHYRPQQGRAASPVRGMTQPRSAAGGAAIADGIPVLHEFPNGLTLIVQQNSNNPTLSLSGIIPAGAIDDPAGRPGTASLAMDMLLNGTARHSKLELAALLEDDALALSYGLGRENSSLSARCLSEDWPKLLGLLAETLCEPAFPADELEKLRQQTLSGLLYSQNDTFEEAFYRARAAVYGAEHPFAGRTEGTLTSVKAIDRADLEQWYRSKPGPAGAVLAIVGDIAPGQVIEQVGKALEFWGAAPSPREALLARGAELTLPEQRDMRVRLPDKNSVSVVWLGPAAAKTDLQWPARLVANFIFGGDFHSRLNARLRVKDGLTYGSHSWFGNGRAPGPWAAKAEVAGPNLERAIAAAHEEMARWAADGPSAEEIETAQAYLTGNFPVRLASNGAVAGVLAEAHYLGRGLDYIRRYRDIIRAVTRAEVAAAAAQFMAPEAQMLVACGTFE